VFVRVWPLWKAQAMVFPSPTRPSGGNKTLPVKPRSTKVSKPSFHEVLYSDVLPSVTASAASDRESQGGGSMGRHRGTSAVMGPSRFAAGRQARGVANVPQKERAHMATRLGLGAVARCQEGASISELCLDAGGRDATGQTGDGECLHLAETVFNTFTSATGAVQRCVIPVQAHSPKKTWSKTAPSAGSTARGPRVAPPSARGVGARRPPPQTKPDGLGALQQAAMAQRCAEAAGLRAARIVADAADAEVAETLASKAPAVARRPSRGGPDRTPWARSGVPAASRLSVSPPLRCATASSTVSGSSSLSCETVCQTGSVGHCNVFPPPLARPAGVRPICTAEVATLTLLPMQLLFRLAEWLMPHDILHAFASHKSLVSAIDEVAAWLAHEFLGLAADAFIAQRRLLRSSSFRALHFLQRRGEAVASSQRRHLAAGLKHSVCVRGGVAYSWGAATSGQLGRGSPADRYHPTPTSIPLASPVVTVACGGDHSILVTACKSVWAFGRNSDGQLGMGCDRDSARPVRVLVPSATQVACGADHSVVLADGGSVWAFGRGNEGQLGVALPEGKDRALWPICNVALPEAWRVACGADHTLVIVGGGGAFGFGENSKGQLGLGHRERQLEPARLRLPHGVMIVDADCGCTHTALVADDSRVFGCGSNDQGQLGYGAANDRLLVAPMLLRSMEAAGNAAATGIFDTSSADVGCAADVLACARRVSCGYSHTLLLTSVGGIWVLGSRGASTGQENTKPWRVRGILDRVRADDVAGGGGHALCAAAGDIFSLGIGSPQLRPSAMPQAPYCRTPTPQQVLM